MEIKTISYQTFLQTVKAKTIIKDTTQALANVANFYNNVIDRHNQTIAYEVNDVDSLTESTISNESEATKNIYARFGIYFKSLINIEDSSIELLEANRQYFIWLDIDSLKQGNSNNPEEALELLESKIRVFNSKYLPEGATPSFYVDLVNYTNYNDVIKRRVEIRSIYPSIDSLIAYTELKKVHVRDNDIEKEINEVLKLDGELVRYDITDVVDEIANRYFTTNMGTHELFVTKLDEVGEKLTQNDYIVYYGYNIDEYILCAVYLTYFHNANCHITGYDKERFFDYLTSLYYNNSDMLVEERVQYLQEFPTYTFSYTDYTPVFKGTLKTEVFGKVQVCALNTPVSVGIEESAIKKENLMFLDNFSFNNANILPLLDYFKLDSKNLEEAKRAEEKLRKILIRLENILNIPENIVLSYTDIFILDVGGELQLGYLENLKFKTYTTVVAGCLINGNNTAGATLYPESISLKEVHRTIPLDIMKDKDIGIKTIMMSDYRFASPKIQEKLGAKKITRLTVKHPIKFSSKYALPLANFYINLSSITLSGISDELFYDMGKYLPDCHHFRLGVNSYLASKLGRNNLRTSSSIISAFGGYHPLCSSTLYINEYNITD